MATNVISIIKTTTTVDAKAMVANVISVIKNKIKSCGCKGYGSKCLGCIAGDYRPDITRNAVIQARVQVVIQAHVQVVI